MLVKNKKEQGGPGKLRSLWEREIYIIRSVKDEAGIIYKVIQEGNLRGKSRVLHRNMLLPCKQLKMAGTNKMEEEKGIERPQKKHRKETEGGSQGW